MCSTTQEIDRLSDKVIFMIAGEASGDLLGASLIESLKVRGYKNFIGVGGTLMMQAGLVSLFPMSDISVMGLLPVIKKLPKILLRISQTINAIVSSSPICLILIDAPDFTHRVAQRVRKIAPSIPIINYVSPTVWAWRPGRAKKMAAYIDCVLALLPFEPEAYRRLSGPRCVYVGHPLLEHDISHKTHELEKIHNVFIIMPGSRIAEIKRMAPIYGDVVELLQSDIKDLDVVVPIAPGMQQLLLEETGKWSVPPRLISQQEKFTYFEKGHLALVTSGLATLELALSEVPMVVAYKVSLIEYFFKFLIKVNSIVLPNLIIGENFVPEFIQDRATAKILASAVKELLDDEHERRQQIAMFARVREALIISGTKPSHRAAEVILEYLR